MRESRVKMTLGEELLTKTGSLGQETGQKAGIAKKTELYRGQRS